jgi:hypothetical protein
MRLTKLWTIPVTALLLTACSTETLTDSTTTPTGDDAVSFARLNVNLPSVPTTRAYTPDAGADNEFKVTGKTRIFLFENEKGAAAKSEDESEDDYTFLYEAEPTEWLSDKDASGDEYNASESFIIKLRGANKSYSNLYALVVLNGDNIPHPSLNETFGHYNAAVSITNGNTSDYLGGTANGFFMANAANGNAASASADPTVLVLLTTYNSPDAARKGPGNNIYVERNAVKVTVTKAQEAYTLKSDAKVTVTPLAWTLTNTNLKMYPFHKVAGLRTGGTNSYTDIWSTKASDGSTVACRFLGPAFDGFRRTLWSMDPNYSTVQTAEFHVAEAKEVTTAFSTSATETTKAVYYPLYCAENTFDIAHMMKGQTTAVIVKAQLTGSTDATYANEAQAAAKPHRFTRGNTSGVTDNCYGNNGHVWSEGYFAKLVAETAGKVFGIPTLTADNVNLAPLLRHINDSLTEKNFTGLKKDNVAFTPNPAQLKELNIRIGPITGYEGGICYYIAYIRHFDDKETPWKSGDPTYVGSDNSVDYNAKYLGRYGVVRNNWYDLSIQDFAYPGSPDIPTPKPTAPDDDNSTILLNIKVNPWAKENTRFVPLE